VALRVLIQRCKHDRKNDIDIVADQVAEVLIVPEIESSLGNLEMGTCDRLCQLVEQRLLDLGKLSRVHDFEDVFNLVEEHDLFGAVDLGPVPQETEHNLHTVLAALRHKAKGQHTSSVRDASFSRN
jgi:hypothetical protein